MSHSLPCRIVPVVAFVLALGVQGLAQSNSPFKIEGSINDFTDPTNAAGPWHITGDWTAELRGRSGHVDFVVGLAMVRSTGAASHTHHVALYDATVTPIANGYRISGNAVIASNGTLAAFTGSHLDVDITGGADVPLSNVKLTFGGAAVSHFGDLPIEGVVTPRR
jgi:hypothetical protein